MANIQIMTMNVRGLRDTVKRTAVFSCLSNICFTFCFLQEVHLRDGGDVEQFKKEWVKGKSVWSVGGVHSSGVGILFGTREVKVEGTYVAMQGRVLGVDITLGDFRLRIIGVYGPQTVPERREMVESLAPLCATNRVLIVGGDFNVELGGVGDSSVGAITGLMASHGLVDGGLNTTPALAGPTWRNSRGVERRLDYVFLPKSLGLLSGRLLPVFFSDHDGVLLRVKAPVCLFGRGYWKLDRDILEERAFVNVFSVFFRGLEGLRPMCGGVLEWWEVVKVRIRVFIIGFCKRKGREERREVEQLQRLLDLEYEFPAARTL